MAKKQTIKIGNETVQLTDREILFADHYIISNNATDAAIKAGYSEKCAGQQGHENLKKPEILKYINFKTKPVFEQLGITQERVLRELVTIGFSDMADYLKNDWSIKDLSEIDPAKTPAIKHIEKTDRGFKIHLQDKLSALYRLWEILKANDKKQQEGKNDFFKHINEYYNNN